MKNYFEFYGIEVRFFIDINETKKIFLSKSREYHPDFHTLSSQEEQDRVLHLSTINNEAWKTLKNDSSRIIKVMLIHDAMTEEGKAFVPQEFLMEMMDVNEMLMELEFEPDEQIRQNAIQRIETLKEELESEGQSSMKKWDDSQNNDILLKVRDYYLKMQYINRLHEKLR